MNTLLKVPMPLTDPVDVLLADVAIRIQLSPTHHGLAVARYGAIQRWIERDDSPLRDKVSLFYPQGSMAIGATIASRLDGEEFDIDLIAQLDLDPATPPHEVLDVLEEAIRGPEGSRYHDKVTRCTRCIQVQYSDMHLDVTPMLRLHDLPERCGYIVHAPEAHATADDRRIVANPWGFADWYVRATPAEHEFAVAFESRAAAYGSTIMLAEAEVEPVPEQEAVHEKSMATIALQLIKRWRNVRYNDREGRCPPSVLLAKLVADNANRTSSLSDELYHQATVIKTTFEAAHARGRLIEVINPSCDTDRFSDRWPGDLAAQRVFIDDLTDLVSKLERLRGECSLTQMQEILADLFGEKPTLDAVKSFVARQGADIATGRSFHIPGRGAFVGAASAAAATAQATPRNTFFGG